MNALSIFALVMSLAPELRQAVVGFIRAARARDEAQLLTAYEAVRRAMLIIRKQ